MLTRQWQINAMTGEERMMNVDIELPIVIKEKSIDMNKVISVLKLKGIITNEDDVKS